MDPQAQHDRDLLLSWASRLGPNETEAWTRWRGTLTPSQRIDVLLSLQASLCGLVAFRYLENHPLPIESSDFRAHLQAVLAAYKWALQLTEQLHAPEGKRPLRLIEDEPRVAHVETSLLALERSLTDAVRVSGRLVKLPIVDAGAFQASFDLFLRDLRRNVFFSPSDPLEFLNPNELVPSDADLPDLGNWLDDAAKMTHLIALLTLLKAHRFLGIADQQISEEDGFRRAQIVAAAVRRELRTLTRFLLVQGVETLAGELEARLLAADGSAPVRLDEASRQLAEFRESIEAIALNVHTQSRAMLDEALPGLRGGPVPVVERERFRNVIKEVRHALKKAAKELRFLAHPPLEVEASGQRGVQRDAWAFRFILRAFVAKATAEVARGDDLSLDLGFVEEFEQHYATFGPQLSRETGYGRRAEIERAVHALRDETRPTVSTLHRAAAECVVFCEHLDATLDRICSNGFAASFDKAEAASELKRYLEMSKGRRGVDRAAAAAFGLAPLSAQAS